MYQREKMYNNFNEEYLAEGWVVANDALDYISPNTLNELKSLKGVSLKYHVNGKDVNGKVMSFRGLRKGSDIAIGLQVSHPNWGDYEIVLDGTLVNELSDYPRNSSKNWPEILSEVSEEINEINHEYIDKSLDSKVEKLKQQLISNINIVMQLKQIDDQAKKYYSAMKNTWIKFKKRFYDSPFIDPAEYEDLEQQYNIADKHYKNLMHQNPVSAGRISVIVTGVKNDSWLYKQVLNSEWNEKATIAELYYSGKLAERPHQQEIIKFDLGDGKNIEVTSHWAVSNGTYIFPDAATAIAFIKGQDEETSDQTIESKAAIFNQSKKQGNELYDACEGIKHTRFKGKIFNNDRVEYLGKVWHYATANEIKKSPNLKYNPFEDVLEDEE